MGVATRLIIAWGWLLLWHLYYRKANCLIVLTFLAPVIFFIMLGMTENALLRRRALLTMYLRPESGLFLLFRGGGLMISWQTLKALVLGVLLAVGSVSWSGEIWLLLGLDAILLALAYGGTVKAAASQARPGFQAMLARRVLAPTNTVAAMVVIVLVEFHAPHPDLRDLTLVEAVHERVEQVQTACNGIGILARGGTAVETVSWWLAETQFTRPELESVAPIAWFVFLCASLTFLWAWSRLLLGILVSPSQVQRLLVRGNLTDELI